MSRRRPGSRLDSCAARGEFREALEYGWQSHRFGREGGTVMFAQTQHASHAACHRDSTALPKRWLDATALQSAAREIFKRDPEPIRNASGVRPLQPVVFRISPLGPVIARLRRYVRDLRDRFDVLQ